mmetsp:Transcript_1224/g.2835  ORF Transcript_1224/g.2835 Transcript_1224/m.2835 type:complete len:178 (+) Transcript_1224:252-785(+)
MSLFGRGGNSSGSDWYDTQRSEYLREAFRTEHKAQLKWYAKEEGVARASGAFSPGSTGGSLSPGSPSATFATHAAARTMLASRGSMGGAGSSTGGSLGGDRPFPTYMDTVRSMVAPIDISGELAEVRGSGWSTSRGTFRDPRLFKQPLERSHMKMKSERGDYQEACIKRSAIFKTSK